METSRFIEKKSSYSIKTFSGNNENACHHFFQGTGFLDEFFCVLHHVKCFVYSGLVNMLTGGRKFSQLHPNSGFEFLNNRFSAITVS